MRSAARVVLLLLLASAAGCATNPVSGKKELALISEAQEIQMGQEAAKQAAAQFGLVEDPKLQAYVATLGKKLAAQSERPQLPWSFSVVDDPTPNAFALPGGPIFVTRGLLSLMNSEAELVSVLGHEIGHVTARHSVSQLSKAQLAQLGLGLGMILAPELQGLGDLAGQGLGLLFLKYGRDDERQADELGFGYALGQQYDVREMADVFRALQRSSELQGGGGRLPTWMASHPSEPDRIAAVQARIDALGADRKPGRVGRDEFLQQLDGLTFGENPRNGFFREGTFYHPDLQFQFTVPADWKTQNSAQAVMAVSARQDAAFQLAMVPGAATPEAAAQKFATQQGVQVGRAARETFNGVPAVVTPFQAQTQQGALQGYVAFLHYEGKTYQMVTYAPAQAVSGYDATFRRIIGSFGPVKERRILEVKPRTLDIVTLPEAMSLAQFRQRNGIELPLEQLAVINQVEDPAASIPAGTRLKRVVGAAP
jgi:predicted Zn-dependent protease